GKVLVMPNESGPPITPIVRSSESLWLCTSSANSAGNPPLFSAARKGHVYGWKNGVNVYSGCAGGGSHLTISPTASSFSRDAAPIASNLIVPDIVCIGPGGSGDGRSVTGSAGPSAHFASADVAHGCTRTDASAANPPFFEPTVA